MYNVMSPKAEEFISDEEILECLDYAEKNKNNRALIEQILEKAAKMKGVSHKEAIVLLDCELDDLNEKIYALAEKIKKEEEAILQRERGADPKEQRKLLVKLVAFVVVFAVAILSVVLFATAKKKENIHHEAVIETIEWEEVNE